MIDVEVAIFNEVYPFLSELVPEGEFTSEFVPAPAAFPHVSLIEIDNYPDRRTADSGNKEWSDILAYESQIFANSKGECRTIQRALDDAMIHVLGFEKTQGQFIPNLADQTIYRIVARYIRGVTHSGDLYKPR